MAIAEKSRAIRLPIHITEMLNKLKKGQRELSQEMSRTPTVSELAKYVELPEEDVKDLMCKAGQPVSLETKVGDGEDTVLLDLLAGGEDLPDEQIEMDCMRGDLHSLLHQLPDLQCRVLRMRYGMDGDEPMSLTGIGRVLGISRDRVRNLERDGLRGLRRLSDNVEASTLSLSLLKPLNPSRSKFLTLSLLIPSTLPIPVRDIGSSPSIPYLILKTLHCRSGN